MYKRLILFEEKMPPELSGKGMPKLLREWYVLITYFKIPECI
jgi:hypothetical protein